ncbi:MAG: thrombospondin type 3 repeat-containing protein [bacterium]|nr:thrombospondin type 3 repeat-containing protein [bacterium]
MLAQSAAHPPSAEASTETALLQAIATKDSDGDGLPDWEEAIYGTDPHNPDSKNLGVTDSQAVAQGLIIPKAIADVAGPASSATGAVINPDLPPAPADNTLTAAFAKNFFTIYMAAVERTGGNLSTSDQADVAEQSLAALSSSIVRAPDFKSASDIVVAGSGADAMKLFAASAEAVMNANTASANKSELQYLSDAAQNGDTSAVLRIVSLAKAYRGSAAGLAQLPVPSELAAEDLAVVNALARLSEITSDFARVDSDPLATMLALQQYPKVVIALVDAFIAIEKDYKAAGITLAPGTPGASFVNIVADIAASQAAQKP